MNDDILIKKLVSILNNYNKNYNFDVNKQAYERALELDSIDFTNFILDLEQEFNIDISEKDLNSFKNLNTILKMLKKKKTQLE